MKEKISLFIWLNLLLLNSQSQTILQQYILEGFEKNQGIQQQEIALEKSIVALKEARSLFLPSVSFSTDYFLADGGRSVDFPAGDLLNPVYQTLNQLTGSTAFPQLNNQSILLNPNHFYDAKFRTTLTLLNLEIEYNRRIKKDRIELQKAEKDLYKRELAKEIKIAYFRYLQSIQAIKILDNAIVMVAESQRVNESLFQNDKTNRTSVIRAANEVTRVKALYSEATFQARSAKFHFNFLLNRNLNDTILVDTSYQKPPQKFDLIKDISAQEELKKLQVAGSISRNAEALSKSYLIPKLSTFLDIGSQGFDGKFNNKTRYYFLGLSMKWDIFSSGKNRFKTLQTLADSRILASQTDEVSNQLRLRYENAVNEFQAALSDYKAAESISASSLQYYNDMMKLYKEGQIIYIELLDAQNQLQQSKIRLNIALYNTYIKAAEIERANASFNINL